MNYKNRKFRPTELMNYMNDLFGSKVTGRPFTQADINAYIVKGHVPSHYGGFKIVKLKQYDFKGCLVKLEDRGNIEKLRVSKAV